MKPRVGYDLEDLVVGTASLGCEHFRARSSCQNPVVHLLIASRVEQSGIRRARLTPAGKIGAVATGASRAEGLLAEAHRVKPCLKLGFSFGHPEPICEGLRQRR